jgi:hypothetical protein
MILSGSTVSDILSPVNHSLKELKLSFSEDNYCAKLCQLGISSFLNLQLLHLASWPLDNDVQPQEIYDTLLSGPIPEVCWHHKEFYTETFTLAMASRICTALSYADYPELSLKRFQLEVLLALGCGFRFDEINQRLLSLKASIKNPYVDAAVHITRSKY